MGMVEKDSGRACIGRCEVQPAGAMRRMIGSCYDQHAMENPKTEDSAIPIGNVGVLARARARLEVAVKRATDQRLRAAGR
jgi:hypothetical protein